MGSKASVDLAAVGLRRVEGCQETGKGHGESPYPWSMYPPIIPLRLRNRVWFVVGSLVALVIVACTEGDAAVDVEPPPPGPIRFMSLTAGARHTCGLDGDGVAYCWGWDADGQLGALQPGAFLGTVLPVFTDVRFLQLAAGSQQTCGLSIEGDVYCWGRGTWGVHPVPTRVEGGDTFVDLSGRWRDVCGVVADGGVRCFGEENAGQLGTGRHGEGLHFMPQVALLDEEAVRVEVGRWFACALLTSGTRSCWGQDQRGELGRGDAEPGPCTNSRGSLVRCSAVPVPGVGPSPVLDLGIAMLHGCALSEGGWVDCWGDNGAGQLGTDEELPQCPGWEPNQAGPCSRVPLRVEGLPPVEAVFIGGFHSCALEASGQAWCWGSNTFGQLGRGGTLGRVPFVSMVRGGVAFTELALGQVHTCGLDAEGLAYCWGNNIGGQLGSTVELATFPTAVSLFPPRD